jgi:endoglucanase
MKRLLALLAILFALNQWNPSPAARAQSTLPDSGFWHTEGTQILDAANQPVRINGVTWYGMESSHWVPAGLGFQRYTTIMDEVKLLGFNTIRLPLSNELIESNPIVTKGILANPEFKGKHALDILDAIVNWAHQIGLKIILDDHRSRAGRPMGVNTLDEGLWYTPQYPESAWIHDWQTLALRYRNNDAVIGFDLRNEPHTDGVGPWDLNAYLHRSPTWGPYNGVDDPGTDWRLAAERAGNAVLGINPHLLIIVQGLPIYPDSTAPGGVAASWWAGLLTPVKPYPVQLAVPHQLVYAVHEWGPRKAAMPWFSPLTYAGLSAALHRNWAYLLDDPSAPYAAPVWLGEFGTCTDNSACLQTGPQGKWFGLMLRYLREHPQISWSFWALNGTNSNNCWADNGVLNAKWNTVQSTTLQAELRSLQAVPGLLPAGTATPLIPGTDHARPPRSPASPLCQLP